MSVKWLLLSADVCLSDFVSKVFSWPSFLSSQAFWSLLEDHWSMFVIWHLNIFMESHFWLFMSVAKTLSSWRKQVVHLGEKRFTCVGNPCKSTLTHRTKLNSWLITEFEELKKWAMIECYLQVCRGTLFNDILLWNFSSYQRLWYGLNMATYEKWIALQIG